MAESVQQYLSRISSYAWWIVVLELLLIGVVVHSVITFMRGTRGARLIKGTALFLVVAYVIIKLAGDKLVRVEFLYSKILFFATFAVVVVFQPELRRALIRLGEARLFRSMSTPVRSTADTVCRTVAYCSKNRIGALMAIEREVGLGALMENGTVMNADLSAELLNTIFWPGSVLHDMGVVIRAGKLAAAGVQFPMSEAADLSQELGSRHRAALGLSEETDAVVVVVSEETGIISVAENGRLIRNLTLEGLENLLLEMLSQSDAGVHRRKAAA